MNNPERKRIQETVSIGLAVLLEGPLDALGDRVKVEEGRILATYPTATDLGITIGQDWGGIYTAYIRFNRPETDAEMDKRKKQEAISKDRLARRRAKEKNRRETEAKEKTKREIELLNTLVRKYGVDNITL